MYMYMYVYTYMYIYSTAQEKLMQMHHTVPKAYLERTMGEPRAYLE